MAGHSQERLRDLLPNYFLERRAELKIAPYLSVVTQREVREESHAVTNIEVTIGRGWKQEGRRGKEKQVRIEGLTLGEMEETELEYRMFKLKVEDGTDHISSNFSVKFKLSMAL